MWRFCTVRAPLLVALTLAGGPLLPSAAQAQLFGPQRPLTIEVISPRLGLLNPLLPSRLLPKETSGGWPLTIRFTSNDEIGIGTAFTPFFPEDGVTGFLIFADPDGCPSFSPAVISNENSPCFNAPVDETFFEFTNDTDLVGVPDHEGNTIRQAALTDSFGGGRPSMLVFNSTTGENSSLQAYGPRTSANSTDTLVQRCVSRFGVTNLACSSDADCVGPFAGTCQTVPLEVDGKGWGADDDAPGVVLLANTGPGVVLDSSFNFPAGPKQLRNLGGFLTSVAWEMNDSVKHSDVVLHMNVPDGLFKPVVQMDTCVGIPSNVQGVCSGGQLFRVDGGPAATGITNLGDKVTTLRIFVVNGTAPSVLSDLDGNGVVDSKDAVLAGYALISKEATLRFRTFSQDEVPGFLVDLDGNHEAPHPPLPAGGGQVSPIPR
jgi:hypothetical protein